MLGLLAALYDRFRNGHWFKKNNKKFDIFFVRNTGTADSGQAGAGGLSCNQLFLQGLENKLWRFSKPWKNVQKKAKKVFIYLDMKIAKGYIIPCLWRGFELVLFSRSAESWFGQFF